MNEDFTNVDVDLNLETIKYLVSSLCNSRIIEPASQSIISESIDLIEEESSFDDACLLLGRALINDKLIELIKLGLEDFKLENPGVLDEGE